MRTLPGLFFAGMLLSPFAQAGTLERIVGLPCEGCEAVFSGLPTGISSAVRIAPENEPGEPLKVSGTVRNADGTTQPDVIIYAYQTDAAGHYPHDPALTGSAARHGRLRTWVRSDDAGRYELVTIRPASYPGTKIPQHIHLHVIEPGRCTYYIGDVLFADDPLLTPSLQAREADARGGNGVVHPEKGAYGSWQATRDITLGANVPGYAECAPAGA